MGGCCGIKTNKFDNDDIQGKIKNSQRMSLNIMGKTKTQDILEVATPQNLNSQNK